MSAAPASVAVQAGVSGVPRSPRAPVVSVGNLAMGGRGKTPVVAFVARLLIEAGERPAILSRGYGRRTHEDGVVIVSDGRDIFADLDRSGDEPLMLARQLLGSRHRSPEGATGPAATGASVLVCDVRAMAAALAETQLGVTVHVLDDGFQHTSLVRDIDIVLVTGGDLRDRRLPVGRLRSPVRALGRADAVIVDGSDEAEAREALASVLDPARTAIFSLQRHLGGAVWIDAAPDARLETSGGRGVPGAPPVAADGPVVAVAGIARPDRFVRSLDLAGWTVADLVPFGDHHRYGRADLDRIARVAAGRPVVTTEKDAVRLLPLRPLPFPAAAVPLVATIEPVSAFTDWFRTRLAEVRQ